MNFDRLSRCLILTALLLPAAVGAQGFGLNEIGSCAVARGFAVTSVPCNDPSEIYWNPAATTGLARMGLVCRRRRRAGERWLQRRQHRAEAFRAMSRPSFHRTSS